MNSTKSVKTNKTQKKNVDESDVTVNHTIIDGNDSDTERGNVWGSDIDESVLLSCYDEAGGVKAAPLENEYLNNQTNVFRNGIGTEVELIASSEGYKNSDSYLFTITEDTPTTGFLFQNTKCFL